MQVSFQDQCIQLIRKATKHQHVQITNSGNLAIFAGLYYAKCAGYTTLLICDQGGWLTYPDYAHLLGMQVVTLTTNDGVIIPQTLTNYKSAVLLFTSFAGYFAEQPLAEIARVAKEHNILLIEDASSAFGDERMCNGTYTDIIVASFGTWKIVENHHGGCITLKNPKLAQKEVKSLIKPIQLDYQKLHASLSSAQLRLTTLLKQAEEVKKDLHKLGIQTLHPEKRGVVVVAPYTSENEREKIERYCTEKKFEYHQCPREIRVLRPAISIELKK